MSDKYLQAIKDTYMASTTNAQKNAQSYLHESFNKDPVPLMMQLLTILNAETNEDNVRQQAATVIANFIKRDSLLFGTTWEKVSQSDSQKIKTQLIKGLGYTSKKVRQAASYAIATIAGIDIPKKKWPKLISIIHDAAKNENDDYKIAAIIAFQYLCSELKAANYILNEYDLKNIIQTICSGIEEGNKDQIKEESLRLLTICTVYDTSCFTDNVIRNYVVDRALKCLNVKEQKVEKVALEFFVFYLQNCFQKLYDVKQNLMLKLLQIIKQSKQNSVLAMEFIQNAAQKDIQIRQICEELKKPVDRNLIKQYVDQLINILTKVLTCCERYDENVIREAAYRALLKICQGYGSDCHAKIVKIHQMYLVSKDWKQKQCAALVIASLTQTSFQASRQYIKASLQKIWALTQDKDQFVVESNLIGISQIFDKLGDFILTSEEYPKYFQKIFLLAQKDHEIYINGLQAMSKITNHLLSKQVVTKLRQSEGFDNLLILHQKLTKADEPEVMNLLTVNINNILRGIESSKPIRQYLQAVIDYLVIPDSSSPKLPLKPYFFCIVQTLLILGKKQIHKTVLKKIIRIIVKSYKNVQEVSHEQLCVLEFISSYKVHLLESRIESIHSMVQKALDVEDDIHHLKIIISLISNLTQLGNQIMNEKNQYYIKTMIQKLDKYGNTEQAVCMLKGLTNIIRFGKSLFQIPVHQYFSSLSVYAQMCLQLLKKKQLPQYIDEMKQNIIFLFLFLFNTVLNDESEADSLVIAESIIDFLVQSTAKKSNPSRGYYLFAVRAAETVINLSISSMSNSASYFDQLQQLVENSQLAQMVKKVSDSDENSKVIRKINTFRKIAVQIIQKKKKKDEK